MRLAVVDGFNPSLARHGYDLNSTADVERYFQLLANPLCGEGVAFVASAKLESGEGAAFLALAAALVRLDAGDRP